MRSTIREAVEANAEEFIRQNFTVSAACKSVCRKQTYDMYVEVCRPMTRGKVLSKGQFSRIVRQVFPDVVLRRLGRRGHSEYHYANIAFSKRSGANGSSASSAQPTVAGGSALPNSLGGMAGVKNLVANGILSGSMVPCSPGSAMYSSAIVAYPSFYSQSCSLNNALNGAYQYGSLPRKLPSLSSISNPAQGQLPETPSITMPFDMQGYHHMDGGAVGYDGTGSGVFDASVTAYDAPDQFEAKASSGGDARHPDGKVMESIADSAMYGAVKVEGAASPEKRNSDGSAIRFAKTNAVKTLAPFARDKADLETLEDLERMVLRVDRAPEAGSAREVGGAVDDMCESDDADDANALQRIFNKYEMLYALAQSSAGTFQDFFALYESSWHYIILSLFEVANDHQQKMATVYIKYVIRMEETFLEGMLDLLVPDDLKPVVLYSPVRLSCFLNMYHDALQHNEAFFKATYNADTLNGNKARDLCDKQYKLRTLFTIRMTQSMSMSFASQSYNKLVANEAETRELLENLDPSKMVISVENVLLRCFWYTGTGTSQGSEIREVVAVVANNMMQKKKSRKLAETIVRMMFESDGDYLHNASVLQSFVLCWTHFFSLFTQDCIIYATGDHNHRMKLVSNLMVVKNFVETLLASVLLYSVCGKASSSLSNIFDRCHVSPVPSLYGPVPPTTTTTNVGNEKQQQEEEEVEEEEEEGEEPHSSANKRRKISNTSVVIVDNQVENDRSHQFDDNMFRFSWTPTSYPGSISSNNTSSSVSPRKNHFDKLVFSKI